MSCRRQATQPQNPLLSHSPIPPVGPSMVELLSGID